MVEYVIKRNGEREVVSYTKVHNRLKRLSREPTVIPDIDPHELAQKVINTIRDNITTSELDVFAADYAASLSTTSPHYLAFAARIAINNHQKNNRTRNYIGVTENLYHNVDTNNVNNPLVSRAYYKFVEKHCMTLEKMIEHQRDYLLTYSGFKAFLASFSLKIKGRAAETPQYMWMRIAVGLHHPRSNHSDIEVPLDVIFARIKETYDALSLLDYTHSSSTIFNISTPTEQLLACFLLGSDDTIEGIYDTLKHSALISKRSGGIGWHFPWRASGSLIRGTNGPSSGPIPFIQNMVKTAEAVNQGGKREGSFAGYMPVDHPDFMDFIRMRGDKGEPAKLTKKIFLGAWISDLFMKRARNLEMWSFFDPDETRREDGKYLNDLWGEEYEARYFELEKARKYRKQIPAIKVLEAMAICQTETGFPYMLYKDACNRKSNQKNLGTINSSNLCTEIVEYSSADEYGCCTLASIALPNFVTETEIDGRIILSYDHKRLASIVQIAILNLDRIIDLNNYPVAEAEVSNMRHRPLSLGVQGWHDTCYKMRIAFDSDEARKLNCEIFETIYYAAMSKSCDIAYDRWKYFSSILRQKNAINIPISYRIRNYDVYECKCTDHETFDRNPLYEHDDNGTNRTLAYKHMFIGDARDLCTHKPRSVSYVQTIHKLYEKTEEKLPNTIGAYTSFNGSPLSQGLFQFDLWDMEENKYVPGKTSMSVTNRWDWESLRAKVMKFGARNSLLIGLMPTASTSNLLGFSEGIEPYQSNIFTRATGFGEYAVFNHYLFKDLVQLGIWNDNVRKNIIANRGSVQYIEGLPEDIKKRYVTVWEMRQRAIIDQAADRGRFVCQSQSMNLFKDRPSVQTVISMHFHAFDRKLKTGMYYLRSKPPIAAIKVGLTHEEENNKTLKVEVRKLERSYSTDLNIGEMTCLSCGC